MITLVLTNEEMGWVEAEAVRRDAIKRAIDADRQRINVTQPDVENDRIGLPGEVGVARYFGVQHDQGTGYKDPGYDMIINRYRVEVKATEVRGGRLCVAEYRIAKGDLDNADILFLTRVARYQGEKPTEVTLVGWVSKRYFLRHAERNVRLLKDKDGKPDGPPTAVLANLHLFPPDLLRDF